MKALVSSAVGILMLAQISCAAGSAAKFASNHSPNSLDDRATVASAKMGPSLPAPEVAVMPIKEGILIAWKPVDDADGYFVYRESKDSEQLLGIGPKDAQGFIDRNPPEEAVKYTVRAFKLSEPSQRQETQALPGTARESHTHTNRPAQSAPAMKVALPM